MSSRENCESWKADEKQATKKKWEPRKLRGGGLSIDSSAVIVVDDKRILAPSLETTNWNTTCLRSRPRRPPRHPLWLEADSHHFGKAARASVLLVMNSG